MVLLVTFPREVWDKHAKWFEDSMNGEELPGMTFQGYRERVEGLVVKALEVELSEEHGNGVLEMRITGSKALLFFGTYIEKIQFEDSEVWVHFRFETWHKIMGKG